MPHFPQKLEKFNATRQTHRFERGAVCANCYFSSSNQAVLAGTKPCLHIFLVVINASGQAPRDSDVSVTAVGDVPGSDHPWGRTEGSNRVVNTGLQELITFIFVEKQQCSGVIFDSWTKD